MKIKTLGLIVLTILVFSCKDKTPTPAPEAKSALSLEQLLYECDSVCSKYLYIYTTLTIDAERERFEFLRDSLAGVNDTSVLPERISHHLKNIKITQDYFAKIVPPMGFYAAKSEMAAAQKTKPPCPCPTVSSVSKMITCQCLIDYLVTYDVAGTFIEDVSINNEHMKAVPDSTYNLTKSKVFKLPESLELNVGDTFRLRLNINYKDSTGLLVPHTIELTEIITGETVEGKK